MNVSDLKNRKITVMGLGLHGGGIGTARFLCEAGARVTVTDIKSKEELASSIEKIRDLKNISYVFGQHRPEDFTASNMVVKNPAVPWTNKYIRLALDNKIPVEMDSSLFFKLSKNPIIGVTGTKGKTTTASLIYEILKAAGRSAVKVGVGQVSVLDKLKEIKKDTVAVFELSSWRLSALGRSGLSPKIAVITNIYPDHLNYYKSMKEYVEDKKNIFLYQDKKDICVINADSGGIKDFEGEIGSRLIRFSKNKIIGAEAIYVENGAIYFNDGVDEKKIMDVKEIKLRGEHNLENVLAAAAVGITLGIEREIIRKAISNFEGVAHRLELAGEIDGVKYYNDTAATTPEAAISAIKSFHGPLVLIAGGSDKKLDVSEFGKVILQKTKRVVFLKGAATDKLISIIKKESGEIAVDKFEIAESMESAVDLARAMAEKGDVILLSPGAASFGLFKNEFDRGDKFKEAVRNLK